MAFFAGQGQPLMAQSEAANGGNSRELHSLLQGLDFRAPSRVAVRQADASHPDPVALGLAKVKTYKFRSVDNPGGSASEIWDFDHGTAGFFVRQLEASLALAEIEAKSGKKTEARALLQSVEKDARGKGCLLIARKAAIDRG